MCKLTAKLGQPLSRHEIDILRRLCSGQTPVEAAESLCLSKRTIDFHCTNIFTKLGTRTLLRAYNEAMAQGIIEPPARKEA